MPFLFRYLHEGRSGIDAGCIDEYGWYFTIRTAKNAKFIQHGSEMKLPKKLKPGETRVWNNVEFTNEQFGPLKLIVWCSRENNEII